ATSAFTLSADSDPVIFALRAAASSGLITPLAFKSSASSSMPVGSAAFPSSQKAFVTQTHVISATIPRTTIPLNIKTLPLNPNDEKRSQQRSLVESYLSPL